MSDLYLPNHQKYEKQEIYKRVVDYIPDYDRSGTLTKVNLDVDNEIAEPDSNVLLIIVHTVYNIDVRMSDGFISKKYGSRSIVMHWNGDKWEFCAESEFHRRYYWREDFSVDEELVQQTGNFYLRKLP